MLTVTVARTSAIEQALVEVAAGDGVVGELGQVGSKVVAVEGLESRPEDEERYIDMTPVIFVFAALAMAARFVSLGLDDQSMYILSGIAFALLYGLRPFISKLQRPKDK